MAHEHSMDDLDAQLRGELALAQASDPVAVPGDDPTFDETAVVAYEVRLVALRGAVGAGRDSDG